MIYTGYYANIPFYARHNLTLVSISGRPPEGFSGLHFKQLAPSWSIFSEWQKTKNEALYTHRFFTEILSKINVNDLKYELTRLQDPILLCYEKEGFCHRHLVRDWLNSFGIECEEFR